MLKTFKKFISICMVLSLPISASAAILYENPWQTGASMATTFVREDRLIAAPAIIHVAATINTLVLPLSAADATASGLSIRICRDSNPGGTPNLGDCIPFNTNQQIPIGAPLPTFDITFTGSMSVSAEEKIWVIISKDSTQGSQFASGVSVQGSALPGGISFDNGVTWQFYRTLQHYMRIEGPQGTVTPVVSSVPTLQGWALVLMSALMSVAGVVVWAKRRHY